MYFNSFNTITSHMRGSSSSSFDAPLLEALRSLAFRTQFRALLTRKRISFFFVVGLKNKLILTTKYFVDENRFT